MHITALWLATMGTSDPAGQEESTDTHFDCKKPSVSFFACLFRKNAIQMWWNCSSYLNLLWQQVYNFVSSFCGFSGQRCCIRPSLEQKARWQVQKSLDQLKNSFYWYLGSSFRIKILTIQLFLCLTVTDTEDRCQKFKKRPQRPQNRYYNPVEFYSFRNKESMFEDEG